MVIKSNNDHDERGLLPYPVIVAATKGDPDAMKIVLESVMRAYSGGTVCP